MVRESVVDARSVRSKKTVTAKNSHSGRSTKNNVHTKVDVPLYKTTNINQKNKSHEKNFTSASNQHSVFNDTEKATNSPSKPRLVSILSPTFGLKLLSEIATKSRSKLRIGCKLPLR